MNDFFLWLYLSFSAVFNNLYSLIISTWDMADEKSIVKMNKMIHKKTGVIYVSLVYTDIARKLRHVYSADIPSLQLLEGKLKCLLVRIPVWKQKKYLYAYRAVYIIQFHYVLDNLNWFLFVFLSNLIINLMYNIKKLYFNDQHMQVQSLKTISIKPDKKV